MDKIKQNALSTKMGDIYHYYLAIKLLLENNNWSRCEIEKFGDIALIDKNNKQIFNIEVKHHIGKNELKIYEEEFLKTLSNWFDIRNIFDENIKLILMTTSTISANNPLKNWNQYDSNKKYKTLQENQTQKNGTTYVNMVKYFHKINKNIDELKKVLAKFDIQHSLFNILEIRNEIKQTSHFSLFKDDEKKKNKVIDELYGLIGRGLENKDKWEITKIQFDQKLIESTTLIQDKILRTNNSIDTNMIDNQISSYKDKQFIKKLENIEFKEDIFQSAIDDYAKTIIEVSERMNLKTSLEFDERLSTYDQSLEKLVNDTKIEFKYKRNLTDIEKSQDSYFKIMDSTKIPFMPEEFDDQTTFFQKGYLHILADDEEKPKKICWSLKPEDQI
ncbi:hypothetical protein CRU86_06830 [Aliarcobacter skirrowii]|uniref:hypothetical protein n=1 Tax=Aliarcobacter skirrowii TaxID=28200 RepID=UPI00100BA517|nr:hypothetical protein [Aliarcobacter skirrowii]RXJ76862.1 hypothetical protein CRU86_06830 [Aliarcobacter skirrowii]